MDNPTVPGYKNHLLTECNVLQCVLVFIIHSVFFFFRGANLYTVDAHYVMASHEVVCVVAGENIMS